MATKRGSHCVYDTKYHLVKGEESGAVAVVLRLLALQAR
jgi:hypothetical protein